MPQRECYHATLFKKKQYKKVKKPQARKNERKKGEGKKLLKIIEDFVDGFINIFQKKS